MNKKIVCIGAVLVDEIYHCREAVLHGTSNPASVTKTPGGVMCNIATHLALLEIPTSFITVAGNDADGAWLIAGCKASGIDMHAAKIANCTTGKYAAILQPDGSLYTAAAVNPCEAFLDIDLLEKNIGLLQEATAIVADTNLSKDVISWLIQFCNTHQLLLCIEPVSVSKAKKLAGIDLHGVFMVTPNVAELTSMNEATLPMTDAIQILLERGVQNVWLRKGAAGSVLHTKDKNITTCAPAVAIKDTTGAGDAALSGYLAARCMGMDIITCLQAGHAMAALVIQSNGATNNTINQQTVFTALQTYYPNE